MFRRVCQVAAPEVKSVTYDCILFVLIFWNRIKQCIVTSVQIPLKIALAQLHGVSKMEDTKLMVTTLSVELVSRLFH